MRLNYLAVGTFLLALILVKLMWAPILSLYTMGVVANQYNSMFVNLEQRIQKLEKFAIAQQQVEPTPEVKDAAAGRKSN